MHIPGLVIKRGILMLTKEEFQQKIQEGVRILDGATGSNLRAAGMPKDCCTEQWVLENPEPLVTLQRAYAAAGSQIIYAPTFQAQPIALKTVGMDAQTEKINEALVALSRSAAPGCLIAGDLTTLAVYCESWNPDCFDLLVENYRRQIRGLIDGGADLVIGTHPHVVQGVDAQDGAVIVYSLGNLVFGGTHKMKTFDGLLVQAALRFDEQGYAGVSLRLLPVLTSGSAPENDFRPVFAQGEDAARILGAVQKDSPFAVSSEMWFPAR